MKNNSSDTRPFILTSTLLVLSISSISFLLVLVYAGFYYKETKVGLETYMKAVFEIWSFGLIYSGLLFLSLLFLISVILMWFSNRIGLFLFLSLTFALFLLILFIKPVDWLNVVLLIILDTALLINIPYFGHLKIGRKAKPVQD
ncbi:MAG: hypothetical protein JW729_09165 [Bacteroidales bacterium]|nr:hypothetical protein [Bacteroidales bacterium]